MGFTEIANVTTSVFGHLSAFNTDSVKAEDSTVNTMSDSCETGDRRNPNDAILVATSGTVLGFVRVGENIHGHTVILRLLVKKDGHFQLVGANAAIFQWGV
jgi:hypothetical protein